MKFTSREDPFGTRTSSPTPTPSNDTSLGPPLLVEQVRNIMLIPRVWCTMHDKGFRLVGGVPSDLTTNNTQVT